MSSTIKRRTVLPQPPGVPGLRFRTYAGEADIPAIVSLLREVNAGFGVPDVPTVEGQRNEIENTTHVDPGSDIILGYVDAVLVAFSQIEWSDTSDGQRLFHSRGWVHPEWRRLGIGSAMLARNEARLLEFSEEQEHAPSAALMTWIEDDDVGATALFAQHGYEKVRVYRHMTRPDLESIDVAPLPAGLEVRTVTPEMLPRLWDGMLESFRDHFGGHDDSPAAYRRWSQDPDVDLGLWAV